MQFIQIFKQSKKVFSFVYLTSYFMLVSCLIELTETYGDCHGWDDCCKLKDTACFVECDLEDKKCKLSDYFVKEYGSIYKVKLFLELYVITKLICLG